MDTVIPRQGYATLLKRAYLRLKLRTIVGPVSCRMLKEWLRPFQSMMIPSSLFPDSLTSLQWAFWRICRSPLAVAGLQPECWVRVGSLPLAAVRMMPRVRIHGDNADNS